MVANAEQMNAGLFRVFEKFFAQLGIPEDIRDQQDAVIANAHLSAAVRFFGAHMPEDGQEHLAEAIRLSPKLLEGEPPRALQSIASSALTEQVRDRNQYVTDVCASLPKVDGALRCSPHEMMAHINATTAFELMTLGYRQRAREYALKALVADLRWLKNRGLLGVLVRP
jgi:hypothetical protein